MTAVGGMEGRKRRAGGMLVDRESLVDVGPEIESRTRHRRAAARHPRSPAAVRVNTRSAGCWPPHGGRGRRGKISAPADGGLTAN